MKTGTALKPVQMCLWGLYLIQWSNQPNIWEGQNIFTLSEQQCLVWDTNFFKHKTTNMVEILGHSCFWLQPWLRLCSLSCTQGIGWSTGLVLRKNGNWSVDDWCIVTITDVTKKICNHYDLTMTLSQRRVSSFECYVGMAGVDAANNFFGGEGTISVSRRPINWKAKTVNTVPSLRVVWWA